MTEFLKIPVDELTDLFLRWIDGAAEALEEAYEPEQLYRINREAEEAMMFFQDLQYLAIERSAEMDTFVFPAYEKFEAAFKAAENRIAMALLKEQK